MTPPRLIALSVWAVLKSTSQLQVDRSSYRRRSAPAINAGTVDDNVYTVWVGPLAPTVKAQTLEEAMRVNEYMCAL